MPEDLELELMRMRRLAELQRRAALKKTESERPVEEKRQETPDEILQRVFVGRAWEVWSAAERQYPAVTAKLKEAIAQLVTLKKITKPITGEQLMGVFRSIGLRVRLNTKIRILESGELKTIAEKIRE